MINTTQSYLRVISAVDILLFFAVIIASAVTEKYVCELNPVPISYLQNEGEEFQPQNTIWDYRKILLSDAEAHGPEAYHILYLSMWVILVSYVVVEIWLYCVMIKAIRSSQKGIEFCKKWIAWRFIILTITFALCAFDISRRQTTCTGLLAVPFIIFRISFFLIVCKFSSMLKQNGSIDTIIMTGSEKL